MWWLACLALLSDGAQVRQVRVAPGETLQVTISGAGAPVVLVPGLFGSAFGFRRLVPLLEPHYRVIIIEPLGVGTSSRPERADYSLGAQADRMAAVLDTFAVRDAVLVAHSLGAGIALRVALRRPDLVGAVVSLDGGPAESAATAGMRRAAELAPWVKLFGGVKLIRRKVRESLVRASGDTTWVADSVVLGYTLGAARDLDGTLKAYLRMSGAREEGRLAPQLGEIHCPVRVLLGGAPHPEAPGARDLRLLARIPDFAADSVPGAGHYLHEERPEVVAASIARLTSPALEARVP